MQQSDNSTDDKAGVPADLEKLQTELEQLAHPQNDGQSVPEPGAKQLDSST